MLSLLLAVALATADAQPPANCNVDTAAMLKLSPYEFDQTDRGWRSLSRPECQASAADLIAAYRRTNWGKLDQNALQISYWHEGQARAMAGETALAIPLLLAGVNPGITGISADFDRQNMSIGTANAEYALATVAFLQGDLAALKKARARLAALPQPSVYAKMVENSPTRLRQSMKWPPNLNIVDELIRCFGKPYSEAYACDAINAAKRGRVP